ncbi:MAG: hypothetical protein HY451_00595 [Parcubacteria group bacterium]|nr:hypothetical protein [Parcubacteria group bacterium]
MKTFVFIFLGLILSFSLVFAQGTETPTASQRPGYKAFPSVRPDVRPDKQERNGGRKEEVRVQLKERLEKVKNEQKRKIVERISQQLDELNARMNNHFGQVLDRLEKVLANIVSRVDKAEANNWDVSAARAMIKSAEEAIASARTAIEAQKARTYTPEITGDEAKLKIEVGEARKALHGDLTGVRQKVKAAFEFVKAVAKALAQSPRIDQLNSPQKDE